MNMKALLRKYFKGKCSEAEQQVVEDYLASGDTPELDALFLETWQEIDRDVKRMPVRTWYSIAAAVMILIISSTGWWLSNNGNKDKMQVAAVTWDTLSNQNNAIQRYHMPDGSVVLLNSYSKLVYNNGYGVNNRELWLDGEAYFEVAQQAAHAFQVHTAAVTTIALGTSFNIATGNRADHGIEISLLSGRVIAASADGFRQILTPGQMLVYHDAKAPQITAFREVNVIDWKNGNMNLDNVSMADVFARLQQRYGCRIVLEDSVLARKTITGEFSSGMSLERVMKSLKYVHNFRYIQGEGKTYIIKSH
ncbi:FecR family protein [Chitinophaga sp. YR573]|uniref:FecR family protein n=1 Tax=Chitinophaga sp. YR573 TaxID=1881040 RepID=UPI0008C17580|nr:FecR domain-containing protein [Chitinophaga sp. YR573]SEW44274.1 FecR family protein [Chitinophaga sp. YR573]